MTKQDVISSVAAAVGLTKADAAKAVDATFAAIAEGLKASGKVQVSGFGTFAITERAARDGRNPRTGEAITLPASKVAKFTAGKGLKDSLNE